MPIIAVRRMLLRFPVSRGLLNQYITAISACLGVLTSASCYGWMTPIFSHLLGPNSEIPMTPQQAPWIMSIIELGNLISPLPAGFLINYIGRKPVILATGPLYIISWLIILYFRSAFMLGASRVLQGFAMGLVFTGTPVYLGEIASNSARGAVTSIFFTSWWLGYLIEYAVGPYLNFYYFTYFTLVLNIPYIILFSFQPESPFYFIMVDKEDKAREALKWFRDGTAQELEEELSEIKQSLSTSMKETRVKDVIATPEDRRALSLLLVLTSVRLLSGTGAISVYSTDMFNLTPNLSISPDIITIAVGVVMLVGSCIGTVTSDTLGRRPLLLISSIGSLICQLITGTYYLLSSKTSLDVSRYSWVAPVFILIYSGLCTAGMYPVCSAYTSELFNTQTRGIASSFSAMAVTVCAFIAMLMYQPVTYHFGLYANFYFYALCTLIGALYFYFTAPETKGKSFSQIRKDLSQIRKDLPQTEFVLK